MSTDVFFSGETFLRIAGRPPAEGMESVAWRYLGARGKHLRPSLCMAAYGDFGGKSPECIAPLAVALEAFHKASLVHDDIEDGDTLRYGEPTLHEAYGVPRAINLGDWLLGFGYLALSKCNLRADVLLEIQKTAAVGHCALAAGQGLELELCAKPPRRVLCENDVLQIYTGKTSAAFEVAVLCGAIAAEVSQDTLVLLKHFAELFGIFYQTADDLADFAGGDLPTLRPTLVLARAIANGCTLAKECWQGGTVRDTEELADAISASGAVESVRKELRTLAAKMQTSLADIGNSAWETRMLRIIESCKAR